MRIALVLVLGSMVAGKSGSTMPPESERQLAREIYQEMIAVKSGYTTGSRRVDGYTERSSGRAATGREVRGRSDVAGAVALHATPTRVSDRSR